MAASHVLKAASIERLDFRDAWRKIKPTDLTLVDPPYLGETDVRDPRAYNADRFERTDFEDLLTLVQEANSNGVNVVLCWSHTEKSRLTGGRRLTVGRDAIWLSQSLINNSPALKFERFHFPVV